MGATVDVLRRESTCGRTWASQVDMRAGICYEGGWCDDADAVGAPAACRASSWARWSARSSSGVLSWLSSFCGVAFTTSSVPVPLAGLLLLVGISTSPCHPGATLRNSSLCCSSFSRCRPCRYCWCLDSSWSMVEEDGVFGSRTYDSRLKG